MSLRLSPWEMNEANLAHVHMRGPPATLVNTVEESQELHFEKGIENQSLSSLRAARYNTLWHPNVESRENRLQESHGGAVPVAHSSMQLPDRPVSPTPANLSILITAHFSFVLCPGLPSGSSRYSGMWDQILRVQPCQDTALALRSSQVTSKGVTTVHSGCTQG